MSTLQDKHLEWRELRRKRVVDTPWVTVEERDYLLPDQTELLGYYVMREADGVTILAQTPDKKLVVVRQFRVGPAVVSYDFPGGAVEMEEDTPLEAAKRELLEETGYTSTDWVEVGHINPATHRMQTTSHIFLAKNCQRTAQPNEDAAEFLEIQLLSNEEITQLIRQSHFTCSVCISAYFKALQLL